jgi:hypothetical protein
MNAMPRRPWLRFSLRTMFVIVTVLSCWLGWESSVVRERQAVRRESEERGFFHFVSADEYLRRYPPGDTRPDVARVSIFRQWLGDEAIQEIWYYRDDQRISEVEQRRLAKAFPEAEIQGMLPIPCHPGCFPRGTPVDTPRGRRPIESIRPGDSITALLTTGESVNAEVQSVFTTENRLWSVETEAGVLLTTETQPLCLAFDATQPAGELQPGDAILCRRDDGAIQSIRVLAVAPADRTERVFNLVLGDSEIFIANGVLARSKPPALTHRRSLQ